MSKRACVSIIVLIASAILGNHVAMAQVSPAELRNPKLKMLEQTYLADLIALHESISRLKFPFKLSLNRNVGLDPKDQVGADSRGLEFVIFNERKLLKVTANYNAAFDADLVTANQRGGRVLSEVILPTLHVLANRFGEKDPFDGFGFEIGYHVRINKRSHGYEGNEVLVMVFDKEDALRYADLREDDKKQEILNRSEIYLNGNPIQLALVQGE
jgi:hypothetical protein